MLVQHRIPSIKRLGLLLPTLVGMLVHRITPSINCLGVLLLSPGWDANPAQDTQHKETRSITTPPGWDANPSPDPQHKVTRSITTTYIYITKEGVFFRMVACDTHVLETPLVKPDSLRSNTAASALRVSRENSAK